MRILLSAALVAAVPARAEQDEQFWLNATAFRSLGPATLALEIQPRIGDGVSRRDQLLLRPLVTVQATRTLAVGQGYAHVLHPNEVTEDRSFQQVNWVPGRVGPGDLSLRTRFEQRWRSDGRDTGWRLRQLARYRLPLRRERRGVAALGWAEGFAAFNATDWGARRGFDQLRTFAGVELPLSGRSTAELGYLNQVIDRPGPATRVNHVASVTLLLR